ncbi:hypothetical protein Bbelb_299590 [Branchiostoma belcheri]|nr:hypothetical protein Bbelb_299590 [Branchiostoma belcheri]
MSTTENSADGQNVDGKRGLGASSTFSGTSTEDLLSSKEELQTKRECTSKDLGQSTRGKSRRKTVLFNYIPRHHSPGKSTEDARCLFRQEEEPANVCEVLPGTSSAGETTLTRECSPHHGVDSKRSDAGMAGQKPSDSDQQDFSYGGKESDNPAVSTGDDKELRGVSPEPLDALSLLADVGVSMQKIPRGCHVNSPCFVSDDPGVIQTFVKTSEDGRSQHKDGISIRRGVSKTASVTTDTQDDDNYVPHDHRTQNAIQNTTGYRASSGSYHQSQQLKGLSVPFNTPKPTLMALSQQSERDKKQATSAKRKGVCSQKSTKICKKQRAAAVSVNATKDGEQNVANKACPVLSIESAVGKTGTVDNRLSFNETRTTADRQWVVFILYTPQSRPEAPTVATQEQEENVQID